MEQNSPDYFAIAWQERGSLSQQTTHQFLNIYWPLR
ncbi:hypothetical protein J4731_21980 [Providencia rettgeri]|nr:hypothetical protein [Providencia rettgeri]